MIRFLLIIYLFAKHFGHIFIWKIFKKLLLKKFRLWIFNAFCFLDTFVSWTDLDDKYLQTIQYKWVRIKKSYYHRYGFKLYLTVFGHMYFAKISTAFDLRLCTNHVDKGGGRGVVKMSMFVYEEGGGVKCLST